jgi:SAM-dependent methyltransferase
MPRVAKTIIPRIKKSLRERGLLTSLFRSFLLPGHLFKEYNAARALQPGGSPCEFDREHGVDTDGSYEGCTFLTDLDIPSENWIDANDYLAIEPIRFKYVLASLDIAFEGYAFIDFGSGKGRALLLASELPFKRILGLEFSPQLHRIAQENIRRYNSSTQRCRDILSLNVDFVNFQLPPEASIFFFFNPCRTQVLAKVMVEIGRSLRTYPRSTYIAYVAPTPEQDRLLVSADFLEKICENRVFNFCLYRSRL